MSEIKDQPSSPAPNGVNAPRAFEGLKLESLGPQFYGCMLYKQGGAFAILKEALDRLSQPSMLELCTHLKDVLIDGRFGRRAPSTSGAHAYRSTSSASSAWGSMAVGDEWTYESAERPTLRRLQQYATIFASRKGIILRSSISDGRISVRRLPDDADRSSPKSKHNFHLMAVGDTMVLAGDRMESTRKAAQIYASRKGIKIASKAVGGTIILTRTA